MEYRKNDMVTLDIVDCGMNGEGIGKADGFTVFVKDAVIGDRITVTLDIVDCGMNGEGIGKADGFTVFVKDAVIGDRITAKIMKAKKNYGYGRLMEILVPSPDRTEPVCPSARQCGGCQLQALSYRKQLAFKEEKVRGHLERIGGFTDLPMEPIIGINSLLLKKKRYEATWKESEDLQTFQWNLLLGWTSPFTTEIRLSSQ